MTRAGNGRPQRAVDFHGARGVSGVSGVRRVRGVRGGKCTIESVSVSSVVSIEGAEYPESAEHAEYAECTIESVSVSVQLFQSIEEAAAAEDCARRRGLGGARRTQGMRGRRGLR